ncbi:Aste57867_8771 [Aphanomyces stellatus]|uniref:Aste57867_8771 protein n=1 Tax=Aphanomyces stellatus TaxID=120398 RepID=A0A485KL36_9STRA|nr:hypothetical protein As57867_008737 [Aphanomyces stellatus]VFT85657.1 Aste57867_8771 [Aphanomyces stellatus]
MFVPLSSGEEHFLRSEEAKRRRKQRLVEVRLQEKRIAKERADWYKQRVQDTQSKKVAEKVQIAEQEKAVVLTALHAKYKASLEAIGDAQRLAQDYNANLQRRAKRQLQLLATNDSVDGARFANALDGEHEEHIQRTERERVVRENMRKIQDMAQRQRVHAEKMHRVKAEREEKDRQIRDEMARAVQATREHVVVVHQRPEATSMDRTRFHARGGGDDDNTILRHNPRHDSAVRGWDEGRKKRDAVDRQAQARFDVAQRHDAEAQARGQAAEAVVTAAREAETMLSWLADVDRKFTQQTTARRDLLFQMDQHARDKALTEQQATRAFEAMFDDPGEAQEEMEHTVPTRVAVEDEDDERPRPPPLLQPIKRTRRHQRPPIGPPPMSPADEPRRKSIPTRHDVSTPPQRNRRMAPEDEKNTMSEEMPSTSPTCVPAAPEIPARAALPTQPTLQASRATSLAADSLPKMQDKIPFGSPWSSRETSPVAGKAMPRPSTSPTSEPAVSEMPPRPALPTQQRLHPSRAMSRAADSPNPMPTMRDKSPFGSPWSSRETSPAASEGKSPSTTPAMGETTARRRSASPVTREQEHAASSEDEVETSASPARPLNMPSGVESLSTLGIDTSSSRPTTSKGKRQSSSGSPSLGVSVDPSTLESVLGNPSSDSTLRPPSLPDESHTRRSSASSVVSSPKTPQSDSVPRPTTDGSMPRISPSPTPKSRSMSAMVSPVATRQDATDPLTTEILDEPASVMSERINSRKHLTVVIPDQQAAEESDVRCRSPLSDSFNITFDATSPTLLSPQRRSSMNEFFEYEMPSGDPVPHAFSDPGDVDSQSDALMDEDEPDDLPCYDLNSSMSSVASSTYAHTPEHGHMRQAVQVPKYRPSSSATLRPYRSLSSSSSSGSVNLSPRHQVPKGESATRQRILDLLGSSSSSSASSSKRSNGLDAMLHSTLHRMQALVGHPLGLRDYSLSSVDDSLADGGRSIHSDDDDERPLFEIHRPSLQHVDLSALSSASSSSSSSRDGKMHVDELLDVARRRPFLDDHATVHVQDEPLVLQWVIPARVSPQAAAQDAELSNHSLRTSSSSSAFRATHESLAIQSVSEDGPSSTMPKAAQNGMQARDDDDALEEKASFHSSGRSSTSSVEAMARQIALEPRFGLNAARRESMLADRRRGSTTAWTQSLSPPTKDLMAASAHDETKNDDSLSSSHSSSASVEEYLRQIELEAKAEVARQYTSLSHSSQPDTSTHKPSRSPLNAMGLQEAPPLGHLVSPIDAQQPPPTADGLAPPFALSEFNVPVFDVRASGVIEESMHSQVVQSPPSTQDAHVNIADTSGGTLPRSSQELETNQESPAAQWGAILRDATPLHAVLHSIDESQALPPREGASRRQSSHDELDQSQSWHNEMEASSLSAQSLAASTGLELTEAKLTSHSNGSDSSSNDSSNRSRRSEWLAKAEVAFRQSHEPQPSSTHGPRAPSVSRPSIGGINVDEDVRLVTPSKSENQPPKAPILASEWRVGAAASTCSLDKSTVRRPSRSDTQEARMDTGIMDSIPASAVKNQSVMQGQDDNLHAFASRDMSVYPPGMEEPAWLAEMEDDEEARSYMPPTITGGDSQWHDETTETTDDDAMSSSSGGSSLVGYSLLPPMPNPPMDMSMPPPPVSTLDGAMPLAEQLRLRNPGLYERMVQRKQTTSPPKAVLQAHMAKQATKTKGDARVSSTTAQILMPHADPNPLLSRLSEGSRVPVSAAEMKARSKRLYDQLPEVLERKRQEEVMRMRMNRLKKMKEDEKARRDHRLWRRK